MYHCILITAVFLLFLESHYQYAPQKSPLTLSKYTGCEHDCCFTEQDLLLDAIADTPRKNVTEVEAAVGDDNDADGDFPPEEEYFSLTARCLQEQLSDRLATDESTPASNRSIRPQRHGFHRHDRDRLMTSKAASTSANTAFLLTALATYLFADAAALLN